MGFSVKFRSAVKNFVPDDYKGVCRLADLSDNRLQRLIGGVQASIKAKRAFLTDRFPAGRHRDMVEENVSALETRLKVLLMERGRRGG